MDVSKKYYANPSYWLANVVPANPVLDNRENDVRILSQRTQTLLGNPRQAMV
jgi:hypothetical protein